MYLMGWGGEGRLRGNEEVNDPVSGQIGGIDRRGEKQKTLNRKTTKL